MLDQMRIPFLVVAAGWERRTSGFRGRNDNEKKKNSMLR